MRRRGRAKHDSARLCSTRGGAFSHYGRHPRRPAISKIIRIVGSWRRPTKRDGRGASNLFDDGLLRVFPATFVGGVVEALHEGLKAADEDARCASYEIWGLTKVSRADDSPRSTSGRASSMASQRAIDCAQHADGVKRESMAAAKRLHGSQT